jgi:prolyl-tRNA synthetase
LESAAGIEIGHIFKLGTKYSEAMNCRYLDAEGNPDLLIMRCYGDWSNANRSPYIEQKHDDTGVIAHTDSAYHTPFNRLETLMRKRMISDEAERIYSVLQQKALQVLIMTIDSCGPGEKFSDADLIGTSPPAL